MNPSTLAIGNYLVGVLGVVFGAGAVWGLLKARITRLEEEVRQIKHDEEEERELFRRFEVTYDRVEHMERDVAALKAKGEKNA